MSLDALVTAVRDLESELAQTRHYLKPRGESPTRLQTIPNRPQTPRTPKTGPTIHHGTDNAYKHHRCRCDACRAAHSTAMREYQARRQQKETS